MGVCGCAGVGKEKFDLMTGDKNRSLEARGLRTLTLKNSDFFFENHEIVGNSRIGA